MTILPRWLQPSPKTLNADAPKGPWGGPGNGGGNDNGGGGGGDGPRNPWSLPPSGRKGPARPTALDEFLKKARGGGGGFGGGGFSGLPSSPNARVLWAIGAAILVAAWILLTAIHPIAPQQRGVVTYFGRYAGTLDPGIQLTLPAPIAQVQKVDVQNIRTEDFPETGGENLMLTGDQNIINLAYSVRWNISSPEDYVFQIAEQRSTVRATAESSMREAVANMTLNQALGSGRTRIEAEVQDRMQRVLDSYKAGIRIQGVAIKQADPPERVNEAFKDVTAAQQDAITARNQAQSYLQQLGARAQGEAAQFDKVYGQYKLAPEVTRRRMYYETMEAVLAKTDKTIVEVPGVTPYLPLGNARKLPDAVPAVPAAPAATPAPAAGGGQ
ncbi:FtsH protease activity modulator HflK [uncultured Sphingomonas sp.]|uniref:FtsH protease activity modulator HflK n=1 Tax=uncultured Sphingomonas sp. TaxID=158754 RepID=UPI0035CB8DB0